MKIEKMNDHQIRCTLTSEDLATRNIKLSELAYGSEKTRALFRDMMQQAAIDVYKRQVISGCCASTFFTCVRILFS